MVDDLTLKLFIFIPGQTATFCLRRRCIALVDLPNQFVRSAFQTVCLAKHMKLWIVDQKEKYLMHREIPKESRFCKPHRFIGDSISMGRRHRLSNDWQAASGRRGNLFFSCCKRDWITSLKTPMKQVTTIHNEKLQHQTKGYSGFGCLIDSWLFTKSLVISLANTEDWGCLESKLKSWIISAGFGSEKSLWMKSNSSLEATRNIGIAVRRWDWTEEDQKDFAELKMDERWPWLRSKIQEEPTDAAKDPHYLILSTTASCFQFEAQKTLETKPNTTMWN